LVQFLLSMWAIITLGQAFVWSTRPAQIVRPAGVRPPGGQRKQSGTDNAINDYDGDSVRMEIEMEIATFLFNLVAAGVVTLAAAALLAVVLLPIVLAVVTYRRARRARLWDRTVLTFRANGAASAPRRELARLRLDLDKSIRSARSALDALDATSWPRGDLPALVNRLQRTSALLDAQMALMQSENNEVVLSEFLPPARARVSELMGAVRHVRQAALVVMGGEMEDDLHRLTQDVEREVQALQAGVNALQLLTLDDLVDTSSATGNNRAGDRLRRSAIR
jgi:hypothetical protein